MAQYAVRSDFLCFHMQLLPRRLQLVKVELIRSYLHPSSRNQSLVPSPRVSCCARSKTTALRQTERLGKHGSSRLSRHYY